MRNPPNSSFAYSGLTIIMSPSRFDTKELLSGWSGQYFDGCLLAGGNPKIHRATVDIRSLNCEEPLLEGTKCLLILGQTALSRYLHGVTLDEQRGSPFMFGQIPCVASYLPQDADDRRDYFSGDESEDDDDKDEGETAEGKTTHGKTQRKNWRFWMRQDVKKAVRLTESGLSLPNPRYHLWPTADEVIGLLTTTKGKNLYFDIETDANLQLTCFGFSFDADDIYVVPMLQTYEQPKRYYYNGSTSLILRALAVALRDNTVVIHNSMFDLFVLCWRYGIPLSGPVYDTMLAHNRCYIEVEKSLGHLISFYTNLPYHKNEGIFEPHNYIQTQQLYEYNGKDVFALTQLKPAIDKEAVRLGAVESVEQINRMVLPYLTMTLQGMRLDTEKIASVVDYHTRHNIQLRRILKVITGGLEFNPNSWQQVSKYLYEGQCGQKITKPKEDPTAEATLLQLLLRHNVPAIHAILSYRGNQKAISKASLKSKSKPPRFYFGTFNKETTTPRLTTSWRLAKTVTMRLGSSKLLGRWGDNCLMPEAEVLTKEGWKRLDTVTENDHIMQWSDSDYELSWCKAVPISKPYSGPVIDVSAINHKHVYTSDHRIPVDLRSKKGRAITVMRAEKAAEIKNFWRLPISGSFSGGTISFPAIRVLAMIQADGSVEHGGGIRLEFMKGAKKQRCETLLNQFGIAYTKQSAHDNCERFYIRISSSALFTDLIGVKKLFGSWLLTYDQETLEAFMDEIQYWDATVRNKSFLYYTQHECNASWIATIAHLTGNSATFYSRTNNGVPNSLWTVAVKPRDFTTCEPKHFRTANYQGMVYCLKTETGFFITRQHNKTVITGNCQNWAKLLRKVIVPDPNKAMIQADQSGAEALIVAYLCRPGAMRDLFLYNINPHCFLGMHLFTEQFEAELGYRLTDYVQVPPKVLGERKEWKEISKCIKSSDDWSADRRYYFIAKQGNHSLNYDCKARAFRINTLKKSEGAVVLDLQQSQAVIDTRMRLFPELPSWHQDVVMTARKTNILRNLFGHPRVITQRIEEGMYKELYAFIPQSTVGQITNYAIIEMQERISMGDELLCKAHTDVLQNNHDSVLLQCLPEYAVAVGAELAKHLNRRLISPRGEAFNMKSEIQYSMKSWGEMESKLELC